MKRIPIQGIFLAAALSLSIGPALANVGSAVFATAEKPSAGHASVKPAKGAKVKLVDINHASKAELQTLPGITPALADKIIAGRPYNSKAFLVTRNIIPEAVYQYIRTRISTAPQLK